MVCDDEWKATLVQSLFMVGIFLGSGIFGIIGDKYGRRFTFLICGLSQIIIMNLIPFALNFYAYCIIQMIAGALQQANYIIGFIIVMELFGGLPKTIFGVACQSFFAVAYFYVGIMAYFIRNWQILQFTVSILTLFYIPYYWMLPESIRWLIAKNKQKEAKLIIEKAAKWNGVVIPDNVIEKEFLAIREKVGDKNGRSANVWDLFRNKRMAIVTCIVFYTWIVSTLTYYGLSWNTSWLPGNNYLDFILSGTVEIVSYILCIPIMEIIGRRWSLVIYFGIGGASCIISSLVSIEAVVITFNMMGKFCISAAFSVVYMYTAEVFPTVVRNAGTGFSSLVARIGSIAAPQIVLLSSVASWLPFVIYGLFGLSAAVLDLFLPETKGRDVGDTIEDGVKFLKYINL